MKKALQISIAQTLFTAEEDAYAALETYLASVKAHFRDTAGRDEIIADIESRIAEQLLEAKQGVVTLPAVEKVLALMGRVEDFDDGETTDGKSAGAEEKGPLIGSKRLYRNPDDKFIAGVCSGLAAYFGIEPVWPRLAFVVLTLLNGLGILVYIVLWIIVPEAKTGGQKLEMTGTPVNLSTLSETVRERVAEVAQNRSGLRRVIAFPFRLIGRFFAFLLNIVNPVLRISVGTILVLASVSTLIGVLTAFGFLLSGRVWFNSDIPLSALLPDPLQWIALAAAATAVIIPLLFVLIGGLSLLQKKALMSGTALLGTLGVWFVALIMAGFGAASAIGNYQAITSNTPAYQNVVQPIALSDTFDTLSVIGGFDVDIVQSTSTSLTASGRAKDIEMVQARVENGTLVIDRVPLAQNKFCIFCLTQTPHLTLRVVSLRAVSASNGSSVSSDDFNTAAPLHITLDHGSYGNFALAAGELTVNATNGSDMDLKGAAPSFAAEIDHGSSLSAQYLETRDAVVNANNGSSAHVRASNTLKATASHGSAVSYQGNATVTEQADSGSDISPNADPYSDY